MKKVITMILAIALAITAVAPSNKANAEGVRIETAPADNLTQTPVPNPPSAIIASDKGTPIYKQYDDGETALLSKGIKMNLCLDEVYNYSGPVKWESSRPDIAPISAGGTVTGKKCGKTTITAYYGGVTSYITVNVVKNEYSKKLPNETSKGITSIKFDKKGNIKCVFSAMDKLSKYEIRKAKKNGDIGLYNSKSNLHVGTCDTGKDLVIKNSKGKVVLNRKISNEDRDNFCCKGKMVDIKDYTGGNERLCRVTKGFDYKPGLNKARNIKFTVKKKYLKKLKDVDLRTCKVSFR